MLPDAPGLFSTMNGWPYVFVSCSLSVRARMSVDPPGAQGTIIVTGLSGHAESAIAGGAATVSATSDANDANDVARRAACAASARIDRRCLPFVFMVRSGSCAGRAADYRPTA